MSYIMMRKSNGKTIGDLPGLLLKGLLQLQSAKCYPRCANTRHLLEPTRSGWGRPRGPIRSKEATRNFSSAHYYNTWRLQWGLGMPRARLALAEAQNKLGRHRKISLSVPCCGHSRPPPTWARSLLAL